MEEMLLNKAGLVTYSIGYLRKQLKNENVIRFLKKKI
jgi:hypothetical protein